MFYPSADGYLTPAELEQWAASRETSEEVAAAIHAVSTSSRGPQAIWRSPTLSEAKAVMAQAWTNTDDNKLWWGVERYTRPTE